MILRRILAAVFLLCAFGAPAHAQKTGAAIITEIPLLCPANQVSGACTVTNAQQLWSDIVNAIMPTAPVASGNLACFNGTTGLLQDCGFSPTTVGLTIGVTPITFGTAGRVLFDNGGIRLGEYASVPVGFGGTGLTSGTSGGIPCFITTTTMSSSVALTANAILLGAGAGACPTPLSSLGTTTTVLHGNASGAPSFGAVVLSTDVSGTLPTSNLPSPFTNGTASGNTAEFATVSGSLTSTHSVKVDANGNFVDTGNIPGTVTSAVVSAGVGISTTGTCTITATGTCTVAANNSMGANKIQIFSSGTNATLTVPTGAAWMHLTLVGGGAGAAGSGTAAGSAATAGNNTCVALSGTACSSPVYQAGGGAASSWTTSVGGSGGTCSGSGSFILQQAGGDGLAQVGNASTAVAIPGGAGGAAGGYGYGGAASKGNTAGTNGSGFGGGGQGGGTATTSTSFTGPGGGGGARCEAFVQNPASSYVYTIAATASGGGLGTNGFAGGNGAGGLLIAEFGFN